MSDYVTDDALKAYFTKTIPAYVIRPEGLENLDREEELIRLVHGNLNQIARNFNNTGILNSSKQIVLDETIDKELTLHIAQNFGRALGQIETNYLPVMSGEKAKDVNKEQIIEAFSGLYHIIKPSTASGKYARELIEKALETLELGSVTPPKFVKTLSRQGRDIDNAQTH